MTKPAGSRLRTESSCRGSDRVGSCASSVEVRPIHAAGLAALSDASGTFWSATVWSQSSGAVWSRSPDPATTSGVGVDMAVEQAQQAAGNLLLILDCRGRHAR